MTNNALPTDLVRLIPGWEQCQCDCGSIASHRCLRCGHLCPEGRARPCANSMESLYRQKRTALPALIQKAPAG